MVPSVAHKLVELAFHFLSGGFLPAWRVFTSIPVAQREGDCLVVSPGAGWSSRLDFSRPEFSSRLTQLVQVRGSPRVGFIFSGQYFWTRSFSFCPMVPLAGVTHGGDCLFWGASGRAPSEVVDGAEERLGAPVHSQASGQRWRWRLCSLNYGWPWILGPVRSPWRF